MTHPVIPGPDTNRLPYIPPKPGTVLSLWKGEIQLPRRREPMVDIAQRVIAEHQIAPREMMGPERYRKAAWPRQEAMWRMSQAGHSYAAIGRFFSRDHTTIMYGVAAHEARTFGERVAA